VRVRTRQDDSGIRVAEVARDNSVFGRDRELALLCDFLDTSADGPASCYVVGEAGIGKTTLWQAAVAEARRRSFTVLTSRPTGGEFQLSFASLSDLFGGVLGDVEDELPAPRRSALRVALLLDEPEASPPDPRAIGLAVLSVLQRLSLRGPVLVAIDDAQWMDRPTADALHFALRRLAGGIVWPGRFRTARGRNFSSGVSAWERSSGSCGCASA
jgi:predicted ATPase